ncbi:integ_memb_HG, integral membrane protein [actinobacterium SCGC AAA044-D11]
MSTLNSRQAALNGAMIRFRIMAIYAGVMSLLLWFVNVPTHYLIFKGAYEYLSWISLLHGFTYPIYVLAAFHYCLKAGKSLKSTIFLILAGTLPIASFVAERRALKEFKALA